jgi:hypothetical protein
LAAEGSGGNRLALHHLLGAAGSSPAAAAAAARRFADRYGDAPGWHALGERRKRRQGGGAARAAAAQSGRKEAGHRIGGRGPKHPVLQHPDQFRRAWNPMAIEHRIGRIDRIGQQREVFVFNLVTRGTARWKRCVWKATFMAAARFSNSSLSSMFL